MFQATIDPY